MTENRGHRSAVDVLEEVRDGTPFPLFAMVEIADRCNEACLHCYQVQGRKGEMTTAQVKSVFDELAEMGVLVLAVSGGESTLRPDLLELLRYGREKGFALKLFTNGLSMTSELADALAEIGLLQVDISLYSHRADVHDWITGVPGSFDRSVNGIRLLVERGVRVESKLTLMAANADELQTTAAFVEGLGSHFTFGIELKPREGMSLDPQAVAPSAEQVAAARVFAATRGVGAPPGAPRLRPFDAAGSVCGACATVHVEANGELRPCAILEVPVGDAVSDGLQDAYEKHARPIRDLAWKDVHGCRDCELAPYCNRCHAVSLAEVGDALAPYPSACRGARQTFQRVHGQSPTGRPVEAEEVGPYTETRAGHFEAQQARFDESDRLRREQMPWVRPASTPAADSPERLVQLRRPSGKIVQAGPDGGRYDDRQWERDSE